MLDEKIIDDDDETKDNSLDAINALAEEILASYDDDSEYVDEDDEDEDDEDEIDDEDEDNNLSQDELNQDESEENNQLSQSSDTLATDENASEVDESLIYGKYEIIYSDDDKVAEKYTKLVEDTKMDEFKHEANDVTINKIKSNVNKYIDERTQIQNFLSHTNKEMKISEARGLIEACLFVLGSEGLNAYDLKKVTDLPLAIINNILDEMVSYYQKNKNSGLLLVQYGNRYKFVTKSQYHNYLGLVLNKKSSKALSDSVLETLAVIAYNQPCTKGAIEKIRNKSCINAIEKLKELGLIEADEKSEAIGKPWLYSVTQKFFDLYGIKSLSELPMINRGDKNYQDEIDDHADFISEINEED